MIMKRNLIGKFESNSIYLLICAALSGIIGYLYQIVLGNVLSVEDYGKANILITYISTVSMVIQPISLLASRNVAIFKAKKQEEELTNFLAAVFEIVVIICIIICLLTFGFELVRENDINTFAHATCFAVTLVTNIVYNVFLGIAQGFKQFVKYGLVGLVYVIVKVTTIVASRHIQSIYIVMFSIIISNIICIIILLCPNKQDGIIRKYKRQKLKGWVPEILPFYGWTFIIQLLLGFIINGGDVILIKFIFSDAMAGIYAVSSNLCRIAIIASTPILTIMYAEVAGNLANKNILLDLLKKSMLYCSMIAVIFLGLLNITGKWVVKVLYGMRYEEAILYLPRTSFFIISVVWLNILSQYCMALGKVKMLAFIVIFIITGILISSSIITTVGQLIVASGVIICIGNIYCYCKIAKEELWMFENKN